MSKFIKLTSEFVDDIFTHKQRVLYFGRTDHTSYSDVCLVLDSVEKWISVKETPEEILALIEGKAETPAVPLVDKWRPLTWTERGELQRIYIEALGLNSVGKESQFLLNLILEIEGRCRTASEVVSPGSAPA